MLIRSEGAFLRQKLVPIIRSFVREISTPSYSVLSRLIPVKMPLISLSEDAGRLSKVSCNILLGSDIFLLYASFYVSFLFSFFFVNTFMIPVTHAICAIFCFNFCKFRKQFKKTFRPSLELICTISAPGAY